MQKKDLTEQEQNEILRKQKIRRDAKDLKNYRKRLEAERLTYRQVFDTYAENNRRKRENALGRCALKALDAVRELNRAKDLVPGTLDFMIKEQKVQDAEGIVGFHCSVEFMVVSKEPAHSKEDIDKEIEDTFERMMHETDELFPKGEGA